MLGAPLQLGALSERLVRLWVNPALETVLAWNGHSESFKVTCFGNSGKPTRTISLHYKVGHISKGFEKSQRQH